MRLLLARFNAWFDHQADRYGNVIAWALHHRKSMTLIAVASFVGALALEALPPALFSLTTEKPRFRRPVSAARVVCGSQPVTSTSSSKDAPCGFSSRLSTMPSLLPGFGRVPEAGSVGDAEETFAAMGAFVVFCLEGAATALASAVSAAGRWVTVFRAEGDLRRAGLLCALVVMVISLRLGRATSPVTTATPQWRSAGRVPQEISASCHAVPHSNAHSAQRVQSIGAENEEIFESCAVRHLRTKPRTPGWVARSASTALSSTDFDPWMRTTCWSTSTASISDPR